MSPELEALTRQLDAELRTALLGLAAGKQIDTKTLLALNLQVAELRDIEQAAYVQANEARCLAAASYLIDRGEHELADAIIELLSRYSNSTYNQAK